MQELINDFGTILATYKQNYKLQNCFNYYFVIHLFCNSIIRLLFTPKEAHLALTNRPKPFVLHRLIFLSVL